jgi:hypothetical protein
VTKKIFNPDFKFDIQLGEAQEHEERLYAILSGKKIELKTETWQWEQTGNVAIEYRNNGKLSGIATTEADYWVHELRRDGKTLVWMMFPIERLKDLARRAYHEGRTRRGGDGGLSEMVILPLVDIFK